MQFEVGSRVIRISSGESGFVHDMNKGRVVMVEVRWESTGKKQWLPEEEFRVWDKFSGPVTGPPGGVEQQNLFDAAARQKASLEGRAAKRAYWEEKRRIERLTETLVGLSNNRKTRSRKKAKQ